MTPQVRETGRGETARIGDKREFEELLHRSQAIRVSYDPVRGARGQITPTQTAPTSCTAANAVHPRQPISSIPPHLHCLRRASSSLPWLCFFNSSSRGFHFASGFCWRMPLYTLRTLSTEATFNAATSPALSGF